MKIEDLPEHMQRRVKSVKWNAYMSCIEEVEFHPELPPVVYQSKPSFPNPPWRVNGLGQISKII